MRLPVTKSVPDPEVITEYYGASARVLFARASLWHLYFHVGAEFYRRDADNRVHFLNYGANPRLPARNKRGRLVINRTMKEARQTMVDSPECFFFFNSGITIACSNLRVVREKGGSFVEWDFTNKKQGAGNGGGSLANILDRCHVVAEMKDGEEKSELIRKLATARVLIRFEEGLREEHFSQKSKANNLQTPNKETSYLFMDGYYNGIMETLQIVGLQKVLDYYIWRQGLPGQKDASEIPRYLMMLFAPTKAVTAASNIKDMLIAYVKYVDEKFDPIMLGINNIHEILRIIETIKLRCLRMPNWRVTGPQDKYGRPILGKEETEFLVIEHKPMAGNVPDSLLYSLIAALRFIVLIEDGALKWKMPVGLFVDKALPEIIKAMLEEYKKSTRIGSNKGALAISENMARKAVEEYEESFLAGGVSAQGGSSRLVAIPAPAGAASSAAGNGNDAAKKQA